jgi:hypothetical protein
MLDRSGDPGKGDQDLSAEKIGRVPRRDTAKAGSDGA